MSRAATAAVLLAAVAAAADPFVELVYAFGPGESAAAAKILQKRLDLIGVKGATTKVEDAKRVAIRLETPDRVDDVKALATRVGHLELRRVVDPEAPGYARLRKELADALAKGVEAGKAREVPPESLSGVDRAHWPHGVRWYRNPHPSETLKEDWVLCEVDRYGITEQAIENVRVLGPDITHSANWVVQFQVAERFQDAMEALTSVGEDEEVRLAVIIDGVVVSAPVIRSALRRSGEVNGDESFARTMAAVLGGGVLPRKPEFVEERQE